MSDLLAAKSSLQRAQEINAKQTAERIRLSNAASEAVALIAVLLMAAAVFTLKGAPEMQRWAVIDQEVTYASR